MQERGQGSKCGHADPTLKFKHKHVCLTVLVLKKDFIRNTLWDVHFVLRFYNNHHNCLPHIQRFRVYHRLGALTEAIKENR